jgi:hypothetical protein
MKALILFLITSLSYLSLIHAASSTMRCLSEPKSVKGALKQSTAVFSGQVLEITNRGNFLQARFAAERSWKGVEAQEVFVLTDSTTESPIALAKGIWCLRALKMASCSPARARERKSLSMQKGICSSLEKENFKRRPSNEYRSEAKQALAADSVARWVSSDLRWSLHGFARRCSAPLGGRGLERRTCKSFHVRIKNATE